MDWIDKEIKLIKDNDAAKRDHADRQEVINRQSPAVWSEFRRLIEEAVTKINTSRDMSKRIGEVTFNGDNIQILRIQNLAIPSVIIIITQTHSGISVERSRRREVDSEINRQTENLEYGLDQDGQVAFRNEQGQFLGMQQALEYILKPLVRKHDDLEFYFPSPVA
jgi:hypothetical protein